MSDTNPDLVGFASLSADINKTEKSDTPESTEGVASEVLPEFELKMSNKDITKLVNKWEKIWKESSKKTEWEEKYKENEKYWLGEQFEGVKADKTRPMVDNLIFESLETYLPQATRRNPDPLVTLESSEETDTTKEEFVLKVKNRLADLADKNKLRLKLKKAARHWSIYLLGVVKYGWDLDRDIPVPRIIRPTRIILDPNATIDEDGYTGNRIGEIRKLEAKTILDNISNKNVDNDDEPKSGSDSEAIDLIKEMSKGEDGTEIKFIEWWTPQFTAWTIKGKVLKKKRNPHWNYDEDEEAVKNVDNFGTETEEEVEANNHFPSPQMPYSFLSIFNLGKQPMDETSLIGQNLANQDIINKRNRQIDKNVDNHNGGMVVSLQRAGLTSSQAKGISKSLRKGGVVAIPAGAPRDAIDQYSPNPLSADVFNQLQDTRNRMRDIFGVKGSSQAGLESEQTVRGKIISRGLDTDRIGGGVTEYLEQFADDIYNWFVQLLYVYDSDFRPIEGAQFPKILVSVKEGSLLPKDSTSIANQAIELASAGKLSNIDLFKRLEWPNPEELAANVWLELNAPQLLFKENPLVQEALGLQEENINKDKQDEEDKANKEQERNIETEQVKSGLRGGFPPAKPSQSILSAVPQDV